MSHLLNELAEDKDWFVRFTVPYIKGFLHNKKVADFLYHGFNCFPNFFNSNNGNLFRIFILFENDYKIKNYKLISQLLHLYCSYLVQLWYII